MENSYYVLKLNPIYDRAEVFHTVLVSKSGEALKSYVEGQSVPVYTEESEKQEGKIWSKFFTKGSVLENYNPPASWEDQIQKLATKEEYLERMSNTFDQQLAEMLSSAYMIEEEGK